MSPTVLGSGLRASGSDLGSGLFGIGGYDFSILWAPGSMSPDLVGSGLIGLRAPRTLAGTPQSNCGHPPTTDRSPFFYSTLIGKTLLKKMLIITS